ncbi:MAG: hypothetical protein ACI8W8_003373 [Rhodothermales bacterium]|jgi:hypothetical protein
MSEEENTGPKFWEGLLADWQQQYRREDFDPIAYLKSFDDAELVLRELALCEDVWVSLLPRVAVDGGVAKRFWREYWSDDAIGRRRHVLIGKSKSVQTTALLHNANMAGDPGISQGSIEYLGRWFAEVLRDRDVTRLRKLCEDLTDIRNERWIPAGDYPHATPLERKIVPNRKSMAYRVYYAFVEFLVEHEKLPTQQEVDEACSGPIIGADQFNCELKRLGLRGLVKA